MRPERYNSETLISLLRPRKIATMDDLKEALGTTADATVFRKLSGLRYRTSYSHRGRYYTLDELARFDELGLWSFRQVYYSPEGFARCITPPKDLRAVRECWGRR